MPLSQGSGGNGPAGLALKAWARINPTTGALLASSGIASVSGTGQGPYIVTFTTPFADACYVTKVNHLGVGGGIAAPYISQTATAVTIYAQIDYNGVIAGVSPSYLHTEHYG